MPPRGRRQSTGCWHAKRGSRRVLGVVLASLGTASASGVRPNVLVLSGAEGLGLEMVLAARNESNANVTMVSHENDHWDSAALMKSLGVHQLQCDRNTMSQGCAAVLAGTKFDAVFDFSARTPGHVTAAAALVSTRHYLLFSSSEVYGSSMMHQSFSEDDVLPKGQRGFLPISAVRELQREDAFWKLDPGRSCYTVLRVPPVVTARDTKNRLGQLLLMLTMEEVPLSAAGRTKVSFVDASSVASAALHIMRRAAATSGGDGACCCGQAYNVAQPPVSLEEILRTGADAINATLRTSSSLLPPTYAESVFERVRLASLFPFTLDTSRLAALGWVPARPLLPVVADAARFVRSELLEKATFGSQRRALAEQLPAWLSASPQGMQVLRRYELPVPFEQPEGWPRSHRSGGQRFPPSFLAVPLGALVTRAFLAPRLWETASLALLFGWWLCVILSGSLTSTTMAIAFWVRDLFPWTPPFFFAILSELGLGLISVGFCAWATFSPRGARFEHDACAAVEGIGPKWTSLSMRATVLFFLLGHKISLRFHGDGLGGVPRPAFECHWPWLIVTHEAFHTWIEAFLVFTTYTGFALAVCRTLHCALGHVLAVGDRWSYVTISFPVSLAVMVSVFETHHVLEEAKLLKFAGFTGCIWISLVWLLFLPALLLLAVCRAPRWDTVADKVADKIGQGFDKDGLPIDMKIAKRRGSDDRVALVVTSDTPPASPSLTCKALLMEKERGV